MIKGRFDVEIALLILVILLAVVVGIMWNKIQMLENKPEPKNNHNEIMNDVDKYLNRKFTELGRDIDKRLESDRVHIETLSENTEKRTDELYDLIRKIEDSSDKWVTQELERIQKESKEYTDGRIDFLNKKFFTVINLDDK